MKRFIHVLIVPALVSGCAAPINDQTDALAKISGCCTPVSNLPVAGSLGGSIKAELSPAVTVTEIGGKRSPALRYVLPADAGGKVLLIEATPYDPGLQEYYTQTLRFVPVSVVFLDASGSPMTTTKDSGLIGAKASSWAYSFSAWRHVTVPNEAASVVFYSEPALHGIKQPLNYQFGGMVPAGGILIPMNGSANARYTVFGGFAAVIIAEGEIQKATGK
jgi:hypothetical protein